MTRRHIPPSLKRHYERALKNVPKPKLYKSKPYDGEMVVTTKDYGKMIRHANIISRVRRGRPAMKTYMYNTTIGKANLFHTPIRKVYNPKKKFKPGKKIKKHEWINKYQPGATQRAYIKPKRFLELTPITHNPIATSPQTKRLEKELIESGRVDSGFLDVNTNKRSANYGKVTGHEGRHRAYCSVETRY